MRFGASGVPMSGTAGNAFDGAIENPKSKNENPPSLQSVDSSNWAGLRPAPKLQP
jgi:hypothetical protein